VPHDTLIVEFDAVPPVNVSDTQGNHFTEIGSALGASSSTITILSAQVGSGAPDTITATGQWNMPSMVVHEFKGVSSIAKYSTGSGNSNMSSVSPYEVVPSSYVFATVLANPGGGSYAITAGHGYTLTGVYPGYIADEYLPQANGTTTSSFMLGAATTWGEVSLDFIH
jgi:hypothetical protein